MDKIVLSLLTLVVIFCFGVWPAYGMISGFPKAWTIIFIGIAITLSGVVALYILPEQSLAFRDTKIPFNTAVKFLAIAVTLNCVGNFLFNTILASKSEYTGYYVMVIMAGVPISAQLAQIRFKQVEFTNWTVPAIIIIITGIAMLVVNKTQIDHLNKFFKSLLHQTL